MSGPEPAHYFITHHKFLYFDDNLRTWQVGFLNYPGRLLFCGELPTGRGEV